MAAVQVRYIVHDVDKALAFYCGHLGFMEVMHPAPAFAMLSRGDLRLVLSAPNPAGGGGQSMPTAPSPSRGAGIGFRSRWKILLAPWKSCERQEFGSGITSSQGLAASKSLPRIPQGTPSSCSSRSWTKRGWGRNLEGQGRPESCRSVRVAFDECETGRSARSQSLTDFIQETGSRTGRRSSFARDRFEKRSDLRDNRLPSHCWFLGSGYCGCEAPGAERCGLPTRGSRLDWDGPAGCLTVVWRGTTLCAEGRGKLVDGLTAGAPWKPDEERIGWFPLACAWGAGLCCPVPALWYPGFTTLTCGRAAGVGCLTLANVPAPKG